MQNVQEPLHPERTAANRSGCPQAAALQLADSRHDQAHPAAIEI